MTEDPASERTEQDNDLIRSLAYRAGDLRVYFRRWIDLEIKALEIEFSDLIPKCDDNRRLALELKQGRLNQITYHELAKHLGYLEEEVDNFKGGATDNVVEDMWQLEDGISYLRGLVRELYDMRIMLNSVADGLA